MPWPPTVDELRLDMRGSGAQSPLSPAQDDAARLQQVLDAAVSFVERVRAEFRYDTTDPDQLELPDPPADLRLGTLRLAARWVHRRSSPDAMVNMGELGASRVSSFDADIDRLLGIGRHRGPVLA